MSYRAGIGRGLLYDRASQDPRIICDGCLAERVLEGGFPPKWFLRTGVPPGWRGLRMHDHSESWHLCQACWKAPAPSGEEVG